MVKVLITELASFDLREIYDNILKVSFSEDIANEKVNQIMATIRTLKEFPELGKRAKDNFLGNWDFGTDIRVILSGKYWIVYDCRLEESRIEILRIISTKREMHRIFK